MRVLSILTILLLLPALCVAQDIPKSKDHPLLTRYPESRITEYSKNYNSIEFTTGQDEAGQLVRQAIEGDATVIHYFYKAADSQPSPLQLIRNYQNAIKAIGGEVVYERLPKDMDGGETTLKVTTSGKDIWVKVLPGIFSSPTQSYKLAIVELATMQQVISANQLLDAINKDGYITLYINFDTAKWDLKQDGQATVKEIVAMLKSASNLNITIEGHTDNVGTADANKLLSENRAKSVMSAIVAGGIDAHRLSAVGLGHDRPIADNRTEDGRAKNRRVELIKR